MNLLFSNNYMCLNFFCISSLQWQKLSTLQLLLVYPSLSLPRVVQVSFGYRSQVCISVQFFCFPVDASTTNAVGTKMGLFSSSDYKQLLISPNGRMIRPLPQPLFHTPRPRTLTPMSDGFTKHFTQMYKKRMRELPLFPCINCSRATCGNNRALYSTYKSLLPVRYLEDIAYLIPYQTWWSKKFPNAPFSLSAVEKYLILCKMCNEKLQRVSSSQFKWSVTKQKVAVPLPPSSVTKMTPLERRIISLVQPFGRIYDRSYMTDVYGPMTLVPLEPQRFTEGIYVKTVEQKRFHLGQIFRYPSSVCPYFFEHVDPLVIHEVLQYLSTHHLSYQFLQRPTAVQFSTTPQPTHLRDAETVNQLELMFELRHDPELFGELGDEGNSTVDDVLLTDLRRSEHLYNFTIDWRARTPMIVFFQDRMPIEAMSFPYIFTEGRAGQSV